MARLLLNRLCWVALIWAFGCGSQDAAVHENEVTTALSWVEFRSLKAFQEPTTGLWVADGDTLFSSEKQLREFYEQHVQNGQLIVNRVGNTDDVWDAQTRRHLTYCVSDTFGARKPAVVAAMQGASAEWMAAADVVFVYQPEKDATCSVASDVVFDVQPISGVPYIARAFFPSSDRSAREVLIADSAFTPAAYTLLGVLRHELGHTLGFRHEHTRPETGVCFENSEWRALTPYDQASVMHYPQCNGINSWALELTARDEEGAALLYGAPGTSDGGSPSGADAGTGDPGPSTPDGGVGGEVVEIVTGAVAQGETRVHPAFSVQPGSQFTVDLSGSGDPDLYVRFGAAPTLTDFDCRPYLPGPNEQCNRAVPQGVRTAFVMIRGYDVGAYSARVSYTRPGSVLPLPGESCSTALPIGIDGVPVTGTTGGYTADGTHCTQPASADRFYTFTLTQRSRVAISRTQGPGGTVEVTVEGPATTSCATAPQQACRALDTVLDSGTYFVVVATPPGTPNSYQLALTATPVIDVPPPSAESCDTPGALTLNANSATVNGTTVGKRHDRTGTCGGALGDVVYALTLGVPRQLTVTAAATSAGFRPVVYLQSPTCSMSGNLSCNAAKVGTGLARLTTATLPAGQYFIWVDGIGAGGGTNGSFKLDVTAN